MEDEKKEKKPVPTPKNIQKIKEYFERKDVGKNEPKDFMLFLWNLAFLETD